jgi:hypothetical protein
MAFHSRIDNVIELGGFTSLTEKIIWKALENSGVPYRDWTVRKETADRPKLRLYIELKEEVANPNGHITGAVHAALKGQDADYAAIEDMLGYVPLEVTVLPTGAFARYTALQQAAGADLAWLKPPHMNAPQAALETLLDLVPAK